MRKLEIEFRFCEGHPSGCPGYAYGRRLCRNFNSGVDSMGSNMVQYQYLTKVNSSLSQAREVVMLDLTRGKSAARRVRFNARGVCLARGLAFPTPPPNCNQKSAYRASGGLSR